MAALLAALILVPVAAPPADAAWVGIPRFVRSIGGTGRAGAFPWGIQYNPFSGEFVVTDYLNYQVRRYSAAGEHLGDFPTPYNPADGPDSVLGSVAIDPRNGDVWVGKPLPDTIAHYTSTGQYLGDVAMPKVGPQPANQHYAAWIDFDAAGNLYVLDSHLWNDATKPSQLIKMTTSGALVAAIQLVFPNQGVVESYGIDIAPDGKIFISDSRNRKVHVLNPDGTLYQDIGTAAELGGDLRDVLVDDTTGNVYVVDALNDEIDVFGPGGAHLATLGGEGTLQGARQLTLDGARRLWVTEYGGFRLHAFNLDGTTAAVAPDPAPAPPFGQLGLAKDVAVDPTTGDVWVVETSNQRFSKFAANGAHLGTWGHRANQPPYGLKYPRGIAFDPVNRRVWVANHAGGTIFVYDDQGNFLFQIGDESRRIGTDVGYFEKPFDITFHNGPLGNRAYVIEDGATKLIKALDAATGQQLFQIPRLATGVAVDPANGDIFAIAPKRVFVYSPIAPYGLKRQFGTGGSGGTVGSVVQLQDAADGVFVNGTLYITDNAVSRVVAVNPAAGAQQGFLQGKWGAYSGAPYDFRNPFGIDRDASGRLYVADSNNDRVQVFDPSVAKEAFESVKPAVTLTPMPGGRTEAPFVVRGTATDNVAVAQVEVAVQDPGTGLWWDGLRAVWGTTQYWNLAPWNGTSPSTSVSFAWAFPGARYGSTYRAVVRARDTSNQVTATPTVLEATMLRDTAAPATTISAPTPAQSFGLGPVPLSGQATDDLGVAAVSVAVQDTSTSQWWTGSGWAAEQQWQATTLASAGSTSTGWSASFAAPGAGSYAVSARSTDLAGKLDPAPPAVAFTVTADDVGPPDGTVTTPTPNQSIPQGPITFGGGATDNVGVTAVDVAIKNVNANQWWNGTGWVTAFTWNAATVATPGAPSTTWTYGWTPSATGPYAINLRAKDAAGNIDPTRPYVNFSVVPAGGDTVAPDGTVAVPWPNQAFPAGPVALSGDATDNIGVTRVAVAIKNRNTNQWWNGTGWVTAFTWFANATLASPGATTTGWTYTWTPPAAGLYAVTVRAEDAAANIDGTRPFVNFSTA